MVHEDGCTDQLTRPDYVEIDGPVGTFEILPASTICLGEEIQIIVYSTKAVTITADYRDGNVEQMNAVGDSVVQDTTIFTHTYNNAGCFVPFILLQDFQGCPFAIDSAATVCVIAPPNAAIAQSDTIGCAPFDLGLADATVPGDTSLASWFWRFSDGDTSVVQNPVHTFQTPGLYTIDLLVTDSVGCVDSARTTFEAFSGAVADFVASDTLACSPIDIDFTDLSTGPAVLEWEWYFGDGPGLGDSIQHPTHTYLDDGRFTVTMVIRDVVGCTDTITKQDYIYLRHPEAALEASALLGCNPVDITFRSTGTLTDTTITNYQWCITDSASNLTQCVSSLAVDSIVMPFSEPGNFLVQLVVTDALGCPDSSEVISVSINQRVVPPPLSMRRVSVESDTSVSVFWEPYQLTDFMSYVVYRTDPNGLTVALDTLRDQLMTQYLDHDPALDCSQNVYCYQVLVQNTCEEFSLLSATPQHCTIELTASPDLDAIDLAWTPYIGFNVAAYQIFRVDSYDLGTASFIGSVSGSTLSFTDTATFCRDSITYRVMAINAADTSEVSYSDISASAPLHSEPVEPVDMLFATVVNDTFVSVEWEPYTGYKPDSYYVERSIDGSVWDSLGTFALNTTTFTDTAVAVDEQSYYYRVFAIDSCGDLTPAGMHGRSILLTTSLTVKDPLLNWNHYSQWPLGVLNYEIEIFNESTQSWELIEIVPGNVRSFTDNISRLNQSTYCYRVRATEAGGLSSQSLSNESCVTFAPLVFTPNAFTPNGDGHNDLFRVFVPNLRNAELLIFDRWGELLFRTLNLDDGWDGTYKGQHVQEGVYVFLINGQGEDGTAFTRSGTVTLIR
ncbi:MAG: PKD domain-containing protein [Bacteroidetes bacterium]|nr:MAG: PKD domain-containing protein [Bacteroidota bacterium]